MRAPVLLQKDLRFSGLRRLQPLALSSLVPLVPLFAAIPAKALVDTPGALDRQRSGCCWGDRRLGRLRFLSSSDAQSYRAGNARPADVHQTLLACAAIEGDYL